MKTENSQKTIISISGNDPNMRMDAWWGLVIGVIVVTALLAILKPDPYWRIIYFVRDGMAVTVWITLVSFVLILVFGLVAALGRIARNRALNTLMGLYVELIRGIPLMVQLIWWYYAFPAIVQSLGWKGFQANANTMAIVGLTFCYAAYMSEIYRAGIQSIPKGQMEAARSLGMSYVQAMRYVILPQAIRVIMPPVGNEFIALLKDSSLVSVVAVVDMTRRGREYMSLTFDPINTWIMIALLYLIMTLFAARIVNHIERRTRFER